MIRARLQKVGGFMAGMVIPNIGAFIAWGLITALFLPAGWLPNAYLAKLIQPMILYLLPILIGYTGGRLVHGARGGLVGAVATMGMIVANSLAVVVGHTAGRRVPEKLMKRVSGVLFIGFGIWTLVGLFV